VSGYTKGCRCEIGICPDITLRADSHTGFPRCKSGVLSPPSGFLLRLSVFLETMIHSWYFGRAFDDPCLGLALDCWVSHWSAARDDRIDIRDHDLLATINATPLPTCVNRTDTYFAAAVRTEKKDRHLVIPNAQAQLRCGCMRDNAIQAISITNEMPRCKRNYRIRPPPGIVQDVTHSARGHRVPCHHDAGTLWGSGAVAAV
jgi:hypothetical protein